MLLLLYARLLRIYPACDSNRCKPGARQKGTDTMMNTALVRPVERLDIRVIGVGGAGCSSLSRLLDVLPDNVRFLGIDTGSGASRVRHIADVIQPGRGLGSGGDPAAAIDCFDGYQSSVSNFLFGADVVVVVSGLGRGAGSGIAPLVAQIAKDSGALTIAAVSMPFAFEGRIRSRSASHALNRLQDASDSVIVMHNDDLLKSASNTGSSSVADAFKEADEKMLNSVRVVVTALEVPERRLGQLRPLQGRVPELVPAS